MQKVAHLIDAQRANVGECVALLFAVGTLALGWRCDLDMRAVRPRHGKAARYVATVPGGHTSEAVRATALAARGVALAT